MVYIVVVGMPGSGKDVFVRIALDHEFAQVRMGDVVRSYVEKAGLSPNDEAVGGFANRQREEFGNDIWAIRTLKEMEPGDVVIDGSRSLAEIARFRKELKDELIVVGIDAPKEERFERLRQRGRADDPQTRENFETRDSRETSWGIREAIESADIGLMNDRDLETFRIECRNTLDSIVADCRKSINKVSHST